MIEIKGKYSEAKIFNDNVEETALKQVKELLNQEFSKDQKIRFMPDIHAGKGAVIGTTMTYTDKLAPSMVGVDIGCGVFCFPFRPDKELGVLDFEKLDEVIKTKIENLDYVDRVQTAKEKLGYFYKVELEKELRINAPIHDSYLATFGTLGGGNHFIAVEKSETKEGLYYLLIHTGSRSVGGRIASHHIKVAIKNMKNKEINIKGVVEKLKSEGRHREIEGIIKELSSKKVKINKDFAYLEGTELEAYEEDVIFGAHYARENRLFIANQIVKEMGWNILQTEASEVTFDSPHNYIKYTSKENKMVHKGASSASEGEKIVIPINMRDGSIIAIGKGNKDWNEAAPHGAGRVLSRRKAKELLSTDHFVQQMENVYSSTVGANTIDESPDAYKKKSDILSLIGDTVEVLDTTKPVYNYKNTN